MAAAPNVMTTSSDIKTLAGNQNGNIVGDLNVQGTLSASAVAANFPALNQNTTGQARGILTGGVPASATAAGVAGTIAWEAGFLYVCVATNTWERVATATWV